MSVVSLLADLSPAAAVCLSVSLFAGSLVPWYLLVDTDLPDWRPAARVVRRQAAWTAAAILLLTSPKGADQ